MVRPDTAYAHEERIERVLSNNDTKDLIFTLESHGIIRVLLLSHTHPKHLSFLFFLGFQCLIHRFTNPNIEKISVVESEKNSL